MAKLKNISLVRLNGFYKVFWGPLKKSVWFWGKHAFLIILLLVLSTILFGELLLYKYINAINSQGSDFYFSPVRFDKKTYENVLDKIKHREEILNSPLFKNYQDPFQ
ncbi:MAG: hypothetical protein AAB877_01165 [Patescibacteria group bacterium]